MLQDETDTRAADYKQGLQNNEVAGWKCPMKKHSNTDTYQRTHYQPRIGEKVKDTHAAPLARDSQTRR